jgi:RNA polymerase sigma-70 factor (ECF subfamily)
MSSNEERPQADDTDDAVVGPSGEHEPSGVATAVPERDWSQRSQELSQLLARAGLGDRAAFARLYERTSGHLYAVIQRIQRDRAQAEDLLQEVFVAVWKSAASFDAARSQPLTWLTHVARNRAIDSLRRAQARPRTESLSRDEEDERPDPTAALESPEPGPLDLLGLASERRELLQCMERLTPPQRQSVALAFFDGLSHAEVAEHLREPLGTVKSWVRRALMTLKSCLDRAALRDAEGEGAA